MLLVVFSFFAVGLWTVGLVDVTMREEAHVDYLSKNLWMMIVLFVPVLGSVVWLICGRGQSVSAGGPGIVVRSAAERSRTAGAYDPVAAAAFRRRCRERADNAASPGNSVPRGNPAAREWRRAGAEEGRGARYRCR